MSESVPMSLLVSEQSCQSKNMKWKLREREIIIKDKWIHVTRDHCARNDGSPIDEYYVIHGRNWVNVTPVSTNGQLVMVREYRHGFGEVLLGLPGGLIDDEDSSPIDAGRRELLEEIGEVEILSIEQTAAMIVNPSTHTNTGFSCLAVIQEKSLVQAASKEADIVVEIHDYVEIVRAVLNDEFSFSGYDASSILRSLFKLQKHAHFLSSEFRKKIQLLFLESSGSF